MRRNRVKLGVALFLAGLAMILSGASLFGGPLEIDINATDIETGFPVDGTVTILNCSDQSHVLAQAPIVDGLASIEWNSTWSSGYVINISGGADYIPVLLDNNSYCYHDLQDFRIELYPKDTNSITVTVKDWYSKKPITGAKVWVYRTNINKTIDQTNNHLCMKEYCVTDENGTTRLIVPNPGTYRIVIEHEEYEDANTTTPKFGSDGIQPGQDWSTLVYTNATTIVSGVLRDKWNNKPVENAKITIVEHYKGLPIGEDPYHYNTTTNQNGYWEIHVPASMLETSYDIKIEHPDYGTTYDYNGVSGIEGGYKGGNTDIQTLIEGPIEVTVSMVDCYSPSTPIPNATITLYSLEKPGWDYTIETNSSGIATVRVRNTSTGCSGYGLSSSKEGYDTYYYSPLSTTKLDACMDGGATISGIVVDDQNKSIEIGGVSLTIESGGVTYETTTSSDGWFSIRANANTSSQEITAEKNGYDTTTVTRTVPFYGGDPSWSVQINLSGANHISGFVVDRERDKKTGTYRIEGATIKVYNYSTGEQYYEVSTDANGFYTLSIPSTGTYKISYSKVLYTTTDMVIGPGEKPPQEVELYGATRIEIDVIDEINHKPIIPDTMTVADGEGHGYAFVPQDSKIILYAAVSTPYNITLTRDGYETRTIQAYGSYTDIVTMTGAGLITGIVTDKFSGKEISGAYVLLLDNNTGEKEYETITALGNYSFRIDNSREYTIAVFKTGYKPIGPQYIGKIGTNLTKNYTLEASLDLRVYDWQNKRPVPNATVFVYHYYNNTIRELELMPTIVNISVECKDKYEDYYETGDGLPVVLDNINVTINHTSKSITYNDSTNESGIVEFWRVPTGVYNVTINGTQQGCVLVDTGWIIDWNETNKTHPLYVGEPQINVTEGGAIYHYSYSVPAILLNVYPARYDGHEYENITTPMNVSYEKTPGSWTRITLHDIPELGYRAQFVPPGVYNVTANSTKYYHNQTNCSVSGTKPINPCLIQVHGKPGTLAIRVRNSEGTYLEGIPVNLTNGTATYSAVTDSNGWANFTLAEWWNITVNGTALGYKVVELPYYYIEPLETTIEEIVIDSTVVTVTVTDDTGPVEGATVSLINLTSGAIATNADGEQLTGTTDENGQIVFTKVIPGDYNLTATEESHGTNTKTVTIEANKDTEITIGLGRTRILVTVTDPGDQPLANIPVTIQQGSTIYQGSTSADGTVLFEQEPMPAGPWNITANGTSQGYNITILKNYDIEAGVTNNVNIVLSRLVLKLTVLSEYDDSPADGVKVEVNTTPVTTHTVPGTGTVDITPGKPGVYEITVNKNNDLGYNSTSFVIDLQKEEERTVRLRENVVKVTVRDEYGEPVLDGVRACVTTTAGGAKILTATGVEACNFTKNGVAVIRQLKQSDTGTFYISVEGQPVGYGWNSTPRTLTNGLDEFDAIVNVTLVNVTVTDGGGNPVLGATVGIHNATDFSVLKNATNDDAICSTNADGWCVIRNIVIYGDPTTAIDINVTVNKDANPYYEDYNVTTLSPGEHKHIELDPLQDILPGNTYYEGFVGEAPVEVFFNLTDVFTGEPIPNATINFYAPAEDYSTLLLKVKTDTTGIARAYIMPGVYDVIVDGSEGGYGLYYLPGYKIGRLVFNHGNTDGNGFISLLVDGQYIYDGAIGGGYFVRIETPGYETWDSFDEGWSALHGTYYDHSSYDPAIFHEFSNPQALEVEIKGSTIIKGRVSDKYASPAQPGKKYLEGARVTLYTLSGTPRYTVTTDANGNYSMRISIYQEGAPAEIQDNQEEYRLTVEKEGYNPYTKQYSQGDYAPVMVHDPALEGNETESGWVLTYDGYGVSGVTVILRDRYGNELYRTCTDATGRFEVPVNPLYLDNYTVRIVDEQENIIEYESGYRVGPTQDETYYVLESGQALYTLQVLDEEDTPVENVRVNITKASNPNMTLEYETNGSIVKFLLDGTNLTTGTYNVTIKGAEKGYQDYSYQVEIPQGYTDETRHINSTRLNLTLVSDEGGTIERVSFAVYNENQTHFIDNGNTTGGYIIKPIIPGTYNLTLIGGIYYFGTENTTNITIPESLAGTIIDVTLVVNETVLVVTSLNETGGAINTTISAWDSNTTERIILHKGETARFMDWYGLEHNVTLLAVVDENTAILEVDGELKQKDEGDIFAKGERNVTIWQVTQTDASTSDGFVVLTLETYKLEVITIGDLTTYYFPDAYNETIISVGDHKYRRVPANHTIIVVPDNERLWREGYLPVEPLAIVPAPGMDGDTGNNISITVKARKLNITLYDPEGNIPEANITVLNPTGIARDGLGRELYGGTSDGSIVFYNILSGEYNVTIDGNQTGYGTRNITVSVDAWTEETSYTIQEQRLSIAYNLSGEDNKTIDPANTNVSLYYTLRGVVATNATGTVMLHTGTASGEFKGLYQLETDNYTVRVSSLDYFDTNVTVESPSPENPMVETEIALTRRNTTIKALDFATQSPVTGEALTIMLTNTTRSETTNLLGQPNTVTTTTGTATFEHLREGTYYVNVSGSVHYYNNDTTVTPRTNRTPITIVLKKKNHAYVNVTTTPGAFLELVHNETGSVVDTLTAGPNGEGMLEANLSEHAGIFYVRASKTGYSTRKSGYLYLSKEGEIKSIELMLAISSGGSSSDSDSGGSSGGGGGYIPPSTPTGGVTVVTHPDTEETLTPRSYSYGSLGVEGIYEALSQGWLIGGIEKVTGESFATPAKRYELARQSSQLGECLTVTKKPFSNDTILVDVSYSCSKEAVIIVAERFERDITARPKQPGVTVYTLDSRSYIGMKRLEKSGGFGILVTTTGNLQKLIDVKPIVLLYNPAEMAGWTPSEPSPPIQEEEYRYDNPLFGPLVWLLALFGVKLDAIGKAIGITLLVLIILIVAGGVLVARYLARKKQPATTTIHIPPARQQPAPPSTITPSSKPTTPSAMPPQKREPERIPSLEEMKKPLIDRKVPTMQDIKREVEKDIEETNREIKQDASKAREELEKADETIKRKTEKLARERGFITRRVDDNKYVVE